MTTRPVEVTEAGHLTEFLYDDGENTETLICAGHGGAVEPGTAETAVELATGRADASCWATFGYDSEQGAFDRWHPPSKAISPAEYPLLGEIADRGFETVVSVHGLGDDEVLVGGGIDATVKERVAERLADAVSVPVAVASDGEYAGTHPENFVNWLRAGDGGGLQLELGKTPRSDEAAAVKSVVDAALDEPWL